MRSLFPLLGLLLLVFSADSQINRCATYDIYLQNIQSKPGYQQAVEHTFNYANSHARLSKNKRSNVPDTIFKIPVVVHIVYNTANQNIADVLVHNQIEVLNQDYRRQNADTGMTRSIFKPVAADAGIEFFLADKDPLGNPTTGITRTQTSNTHFSSFSGGMDDMKFSATGGVNAWDPDRYLNIWVCNLVDPGNPFFATLGFAYPPDGAPNWPTGSTPADPDVQGVVIHYEVFGKPNPLAVGQYAIADQGRTATHEVGHYLGLRHIWGDGPLSFLFPDCSADDGIDDTPNSGNSSQITGCDITKNTCTDTPVDYPDMFENFMDYSEESCQNIFTQGQVDLMRAMLATVRVDLPVITAACDTQDIPMDNGWNLVSGYMIPDVPDMLDVIVPVASEILLVKDGFGQTAIPSLAINTIGDWNVFKGYKIKTSAATVLTLGCTQVDPTASSIRLLPGWSLISYLRDSPMEIAIAMDSIQTDILLVKDGKGNSYIPKLDINTIGNMIPGQGYRIKMANATNLTYPAN